MPKKTVKKAVKKATKKVVKKAVKKATRKTIAKTSQKSRTAHCLTVCGPKKCIQICLNPKGAASGKGHPCKTCGHGHFCDQDHECLSCGCTRKMTIRKYKGN